MKTFKDYWQSLNPVQKNALAEKAITSSNYLSQVANGHRNAGASLISRLRRADKTITMEMMRPDLQTAA